MKTKLALVSTLSALFFPVIAFAAVTLRTLMQVAANYLNLALELLMGFAVLIFIWNVFQYFIRTADSKNKSEASMYVLWSIIGFFVILSFWGLVNVLKNTISLDNGAPTWENIKSDIIPK